MMLKRVDQTIFNCERGDCAQACIATILGLSLNDALDLHSLGDETWFDEMVVWFERKGYITDWETPFNKRIGIGGFFVATVPSRNFNGKTHAVVINKNGYVVHDPNKKNPWWNSRNVFDELGCNFSSYWPFEDNKEED